MLDLPLSCAECFKIWKPQPPGTLWACPGLSGLALLLWWYISNNCKYTAKLDQIFKHQK